MGRWPDGEPVEGTDLSGRLMQDGLNEKVGFHRREHLDRDEVDLGRPFDAIHPLLWMREVGPMPDQIR